MFAKSETLPIFVLQKNYDTQSHSTYLNALRRCSCCTSTRVVVVLWRELRGNAFFIAKNLKKLLTNTMPKNVEGAQTAKYSNGAHILHTFRVKIHSYYSFDDGHRDEYTLDTVVYATSRAEAIGKAIITASAIHPNYDIRPLSFGGYRICEQLD